MKNILVIFMILISSNVFAQKTVEEFSEAIEDNSFLIEEAYNQENRVVQHIANLMWDKDTKSFGFAFTQEWPFGSQSHQLSYTIPFNSILDGKTNGLGDMMLNYRYQLTGHDDLVTLAPRISLILPTGDETKGLGNGVYGFEVNLPASKRLHEYLAAHANVGFRYLPGIKPFIGQDNITLDKSTFFAGASLIALPFYQLNIMLEGIFYKDNSKYSGGLNDQEESTDYYIINPGLRYAIDVETLQIVPGFSVPMKFEDGESTTSYFFYISFEHPF